METDFFLQVYQVARLIPKGRVTSYGAIAKYLSSPRASRSVGYAMNASHNDPTVPAHRVVNRKGVLTGKHFFGGSTLMQDLLESEGVTVVEDQIQEFQKHLWDPMEHLNQEEFLEDLI